MDLQEWELLPNDGFLETHDDGGKKIFSRKFVTSPKNLFNDYFSFQSPKSQKFVDSSKEGNLTSRLPKQLIPLPIQLDYPIVGAKSPDHEETKEIAKIPIVNMEKTQETPVVGVGKADQEMANSQISFKILKETQFDDMKIDSPRVGSRGIAPQIETRVFQYEESEAAIEGKFSNSSKVMVEKDLIVIKDEDVIAWEESNEGLNIWKWSLTGIGAICSFGMAAATICIIILGNGQRKKHHQQNPEFRFQIYSDDKRMKQEVHHATKLNEAMTAMRGVPLTRAHITYGGYYDGL